VTNLCGRPTGLEGIARRVNIDHTRGAATDLWWELWVAYSPGAPGGRRGAGWADWRSGLSWEPKREQGWEPEPGRQGICETFSGQGLRYWFDLIFRFRFPTSAASELRFSTVHKLWPLSCSLIIINYHQLRHLWYAIGLNKAWNAPTTQFLREK